MKLLKCGTLKHLQCGSQSIEKCGGNCNGFFKNSLLKMWCLGYKQNSKVPIVPLVQHPVVNPYRDMIFFIDEAYLTTFVSNIKSCLSNIL